jgi:primosomal protein N' (replication factor Y) (superfamily II helicase)
VDVAPGTVRTIIRFDYAKGAEVAATLRAEVIRSATGRRGAKGGRPTAPLLKVRFDDLEPFLDQ